MVQLAWLGLGNMGHGMAKNILQKAKLDSPVIVWNRTTSKAEDLSKEFGNSTVASSPEDAVAKADIVFTSVAGDKDITGLIDKVLQGDVKGKLFVDTSTVHPDTTNQLNKTIEAQGATFVACPVFGAPAMAESGSLVSVLAGPSAAVEKVKPYTKGVIARAFIDFSDQAPGQATLLKLIGNTFVLQMVEALAEGHTLAEKTGLGNENLHQFIEVMFPGPYAAYSTRMMTGDYYSREKPAFGASLARKDAGHAMHLAEASGTKLRAVELADQHLQDVVKAKGDKGDIAGIYGAVRLEAGLPYENQK